MLGKRKKTKKIRIGDVCGMAYLVNHFGNILESYINHALLNLRRNIDLFSKRDACLIDLLEHPQNIRSILELHVIVRADPGLELLHLQYASGLQIPVYLAVQVVPVADGAAHAAAVDEIEGLARVVGPRRLDVVDDEFAVRGDPLWLDGAEIAPDHFGAGELVCEIERPLHERPC